jgi:hypothetical protein
LTFVVDPSEPPVLASCVDLVVTVIISQFYLSQHVLDV